MSRIDGGAAPLLWGHDSYSRDAHIGVVERAWLEGGGSRGSPPFVPRRSRSLWSDIQDGVIRNVSVGYQINERTSGARQFGRPNEYRVTRWQPMELSLVSVPADPSVGVGRNADDNAQRFTITNMEKSMGYHHRNPGADPAAPAASVASAEEVREAANRAERERISMIRAAVNGLDIPAETVDQWIADGKNVAECRAEIIESLKAQGNADESPYQRRRRPDARRRLLASSPPCCPA